ncbi:HotDog domain-containing protein [Lophiotrema nucula]|uniref:HotDog domain-containing protein n=1 Tax=Lophiotrema nucula TaxID=690887 RepID=A0A6A5Z445_9PLEO|nr:HotDog domain-containing protein [Lophiotrema nucula]
MANWQIRDWLAAARETPPLESDASFFSSVPWTDEWLRNGNYKSTRFASREAKTHTTEDELFSKIIKTDRTVPHCLVLIRRDLLNPRNESSASSTQSQGSSATNPEVVVLFDLQAGLSGFPDTLHGGIACTLLDESLGICVELSRHGLSAGQSQPLTELYTAQLNMSYRRPAKLPGVFMARCWLEKKEGRKYWLKAELCDANGDVCNGADGLWITARPQKI